MSVRLDIWADYVCPYCYAAYQAVEKLGETHPVTVYWRAFELRPAGTVISDADREAVLARRPVFEAMMWEHYGIDIAAGPFGIDSRPAHLVAKAAEAQGREVGAAYQAAVLRAYWQEAADIAHVETLRALAGEVGLTHEAVEAALHNDLYAAQVTHDQQIARNLGFESVPALLFERRYIISGAQPVELLRLYVDQIRMEQMG
jgi:predicted DsbA family dithiol-disulfide isomerase